MKRERVDWRGVRRDAGALGREETEAARDGALGGVGERWDRAVDELRLGGLCLADLDDLEDDGLEARPVDLDDLEDDGLEARPVDLDDLEDDGLELCWRRDELLSSDRPLDELVRELEAARAPRPRRVSP